MAPATKCPAWLAKCAGASGWDVGASASGAMFQCMQLVCAAFALFKIQHSLMQKGERRGHCAIDVFLVVSALCRIPWWLLSLYYYEADTYPTIIVADLTRCALALTYLAQTFYMRQWLAAVIGRHEDVVKVRATMYFVVLDVAAVGMMLLTAVWRIFDKYDFSKYPETGYSIVYDVGNYVFGACSLLASVVFLGFGGATMCKLRDVYRCDSRTLRTFLAVGVVLLGANFSRFFSLFYKLFFQSSGPVGRYMSNLEYQIFCYLLPDTLVAIAVLAGQLEAASGERYNTFAAPFEGGGAGYQ